VQRTYPKHIREKQQRHLPVSGAAPCRRSELLQPRGEVLEGSEKNNLQPCQVADSRTKEGESTACYTYAVPVYTRFARNRRVSKRGDTSTEACSHAHYLRQDRLRRQT
jgi:hypothetical protein